MKMFGGREGIRTPDPLLAKQVLSQLSYTPTFELLHSKIFPRSVHLALPREVPSHSILISRILAQPSASFRAGMQINACIGDLVRNICNVR